MAKSRSQKLLGLAITEQALLIAEVRGNGADREVRHAGALPYPQGAWPQSPGDLGRELRRWLKKEGFTARRVVVGLPARWVLAQPRLLPPADRAAAANLLRLAAETAFPADIKGLVYEYSGQSDRSHARDVLLLAAPGERLAEVRALTQCAGLKIVAITASVAALGAVRRLMAPGRTVVAYLDQSCAELALSHDGALEQVRHIACPPDPKMHAPGVPVELVAQLRRTFAGLPQNGAAGPAHQLVVWNGAGHSEADLRLLGERLGVPAQAQALTALGATGALPQAAAARLGPAVALAAAGLDGVLPMDFAHARLAPPRERGVLRPILWGAALLAVLLAAGTYFVLDTRQKEAQAADLNLRYNPKLPKIQNAQAIVARVLTAQSYYGGNPRFLACLRNILLAFPDDGSVWAINLEVQGNLKGQLVAKATSQNAALAMMDRLRFGGKFTGVTALDLHGSSPNSPEVVITIAFTFVGKE